MLAPFAPIRAQYPGGGRAWQAAAGDGGGRLDYPFAMLTVGHSNHPLPRFLELLAGAGVSAVADVRSTPYSRFLPQYRREPLAAALQAAGIAYVFLGAELGARRDEPEAYDGERVDYERVAALPAFRHGLERLVEGSRRHRIALMCAEREPLDCHRCVLVARRLAEGGLALSHILADGRLEPHAETEERLLAGFAPGTASLFATPGDRAERLAAAWRERGRGMGWQRPSGRGGVRPPVAGRPRLR